jgi:hypothetical protein
MPECILPRDVFDAMKRDGVDVRVRPSTASATIGSIAVECTADMAAWCWTRAAREPDASRRRIYVALAETMESALRMDRG